MPAGRVARGQRIAGPLRAGGVGTFAGVHGIDLDPERLGAVGGVGFLAADERGLRADEGEVALLKALFGNRHVRAVVLRVTLAKAIAIST